MNPLFPPEVYAERRARFLEGLDDGVVVLAAAPVRPRSHDVAHPYRAANDLIYLTGFAEPDTVAVLRPGDRERPYVLFVPERDPKREQWEGRRAGVEGAVEAFGAALAQPIGELAEALPELLADRQRLVYPFNVRPSLDRQIFAALGKLRGTRAKPDRAPHVFVDPRPALHEMRRVKEPRELDLLRQAATITAEAHVEAMRRTRPGQHEYEVAALLDYAFRSRGATGPGYETIAGGGANATILHYTTNSDVLRDGDLLLVDAGAEYRFYNADITRTFPVGKRFTPFQRDLYQGVLTVQVEAIDKMRPGQSAHETSVWSRRRLTEVMLELGLLKGELEKLVEDKAYERFYMHGLGHYLGLDVHDVGTYLRAENAPLAFEAGVVMTVEPGLYVPADADDLPEEMRGIGVRIEDDVLVREGDPEVLTAGVPKTVAAIEALRADAF